LPSWNACEPPIPAGFRKETEMANTKSIEDKVERKKVKRTARKKAAPKAKRTTPRGSNKQRIRKMGRSLGKR